MRSHVRPLLFSVLIHAALAGLIALAVLGVPLPNPPPAHLVEVGEIVVPRARPQPRLGLTAQSPGFSGTAPFQVRVPRDAGREDAFETARTMSIEEQSSLEPFIRALWRKIDQATGYPDVLVRNRVRGNVVVQLTVDRDGRFIGDFRSAEAEDPVLRAYVLAMLVYALTDPVPPSARADRPLVPFAARFDFEIFTVGHTPAPRDFEAQKNVLQFKREAYANPKLNELYDDLMKKLPPIIPIPGGAYIDFIRAYQFAAELSAPDHLSREQSEAAQLEAARTRWLSVIHR